MENMEGGGKKTVLNMGLDQRMIKERSLVRNMGLDSDMVNT